MSSIFRFSITVLIYVVAHLPHSHGQATLEVFTSTLINADALEFFVDSDKGVKIQKRKIVHTKGWSADTLFNHTIIGDIQFFQEFTFHYYPKDSKIGYCDFQRVSHAFYEAGEAHFESVMNRLEFREWKSGTYISNSNHKTLLRKITNPDMFVFEFKRLDLDDAAIDEVYYSLKPYVPKPKSVFSDFMDSDY